MSKTDYILLEPNTVYHIFTHAVDGNNLFKTNDNYLHFLRRWQKQTKGYFYTYAYCLMPNHIHFCIKTTTEKHLLELLKTQEIERETINFSTKLSQTISHCFNGYAQSFNRQQKRKGALFRSRFKRVKVENVLHFKDLVSYIHHNPVHHFEQGSYVDWAFSSYNIMRQPKLYDEHFDLSIDKVIDAFGNLEAFLNYHEEYRRKKHYWVYEENIMAYYK